MRIFKDYSTLDVQLIFCWRNFFHTKILLWCVLCLDMHNSLLAQVSILWPVLILHPSVGDGLSAHAAQTAHETYSLSPESGSDFLNFLATRSQSCFMRSKCFWMSSPGFQLAYLELFSFSVLKQVLLLWKSLMHRREKFSLYAFLIVFSVYDKIFKKKLLL